MNKIVYLIIFFFMSCSMLSQRSYLAEMEEEDSSFFEPRSDFPIMSGDSGKVDRSFSDIKRRTPASVFEMRKEKEAQSMKQSLSARESKLSEQERIQYDQYKSQLGGDSEKLYFLDIPTMEERQDYLLSRGMMDTPLFTQEPGSFLQPDLINLGMSKDEVNQLWGYPARVDVAGNPRYENERWIYKKNGALKYVYFEAGKVGGWSTERP